MVHIDDYRPIAGDDEIDELWKIAERVRHLSLQSINSTPVGGGVAEILTRMVPLLNQLGVVATWDVIKGNQAFFAVTKAFHNALHGSPETITPQMFDVFRETTAENLKLMKVTGDIVLVHDPQPAGLVDLRETAGRRWIWRCHIDISRPNRDVWDFLRPSIEKYDAAIFSMPSFAQRLPSPQYLVYPSIDPLSDKNKDLPKEAVHAALTKYGIDPARPLITQISRFDRLKDPVGVIAAYRLAKKRMDCQLLLAGGGADDDPEGQQVLQEVRDAAAGDRDIHILLLPPYSDLEINALVRGSTIVLQKSLREGFGLTVTEALWKGKPVIGGAVGGIRVQVLNNLTGYVVHSPEGAAQRIVELLADPALCRRLGENGQLHVKQNFVITRHVKDYLLAMLALEHPAGDVVPL
jgi:trehalose synthase